MIEVEDLVVRYPYESLDPRFTVRDTLEEPMRIHRLGGSGRKRRGHAAASRSSCRVEDPLLHQAKDARAADHRAACLFV